MESIGKTVLVAGLVLVLLGLVLMAARHLPFPGRLPGDIVVHRKNIHIYFPLATCLVFSLLFSILLFIFKRR
jgi:hypothetical protein